MRVCVCVCAVSWLGIMLLLLLLCVCACGLGTLFFCNFVGGCDKASKAPTSSIAVLMAGNPFHNASQCHGCHNNYYELVPGALPSRRAGEYSCIFHRLSSFVQPSLFVFDRHPDQWRAFESRYLVAAVLSNECPWRDAADLGVTPNTSTLINGQYDNLFCSRVRLPKGVRRFGTKRQSFITYNTVSL